MAYYRCLSLRGYAPAAIESGPGGVPAPHARLAPCFGGKYLLSFTTDWIWGQGTIRLRMWIRTTTLSFDSRFT